MKYESVRSPGVSFPERPTSRFLSTCDGRRKMFPVRSHWDTAPAPRFQRVNAVKVRTSSHRNAS
jgi:hypothetical protein